MCSRLYVLTLVGIVWLSSLLTAQPSPQPVGLTAVAPPELTDIIISKRVDEVNLAFTVTDKKGRFISNLGPQDFHLLDNQQPPEALKYFRQQSDLPLRVALMIDASDSIKYRFRYEQNAAKVFLKKILRPGKDQAFVLAFDEHIDLVHDLTDDATSLAQSVKRVKPGGSTALYDAVVFACNKLKSSPPSARRAVILLTDGVDTASRALLYDAEQAAARAEVTIFALSTNDLSLDPYPAGEAVMDLIAEPTGGRILPARDESELINAFREVEKALRNQYALAYLPADFKPDGSYRRVEIAALKHGLRVRCRKGYFARQEQTRTLSPQQY
jgi:Ca-activated chloride channel homolog